MKTVLLTTATLVAMTSAAAAADLGYGLSLNTTATAEYNIDAENANVTLEPTLGYTNPIADISVGTELTVFDGDDFTLTDTMPTLDFRAERDVYGATVYGEVAYDLETEARSDATVGLILSF